MSSIFLAAVIFLSFLTLSLAGFGHALVAMPLLTPILGLRLAAPLVALISITGETLMLIRHRRALHFRTVRRLLVGSIAGIPLGVLLLGADEVVGPKVLGLIAAAYGLYGLLNLRLPHIRHPNWAVVFGFTAGLFTGAYNTGGPPLVIYGTCRRWDPAEFKSSLQGLFVVNSLVVVSTHALAGNFNPPVWHSFWMALPAMALGLLVGFRLERYVNPRLFRRLVLILLVILGVRLLLG